MKMLDAADFKRQKMIRDTIECAINLFKFAVFAGMMFGLCYVCCLG